MKLLLKVIAIVILCTNVEAQVVTTIPAFPTETDNIVLTFNIQEASRKDLVGYTGDVYTHTGVKTNLSPVEWDYVIESWGNNTTQPKLTRISTDVYQLTINNPRQFYGLTNDAEHITQLCFVLRSSNSQMQTEDIFVQIYEEGITVQITEPTDLSVFPEVGDQVDFSVLTNTGDTLSLYIGETLVAQETNTTLNFTYTVPDITRKEVIAIAKDTQGNSASDTSYIIPRSAVTVEELPAGVQPGINYIDNSTVTLALYAPYKDFVYLIGDFNDWTFAPEDDNTWTFDEKYYLKRTADGTTYWITLTNITPGQEYGFQYLVDGNLRIPDPYADKILDPWNDQYITNDTYPNLKGYPTGKTENIVSVFQTAQEEYQWQVTDFQRPAKTDLVIYEVLLRDFLESHDYQSLTDSLNYFVRLGINAIELMPISEFEGNESWGYNPMMYFAPDKYYGPKNDLKAFIDAAHEKGIAVILDMVLNHSYNLNPMVRLYFDGSNPTAENPWFNVTAPHTCFSWGSDFNHESPQTQEFVDRVTSYWLTEYKFDGFRFDFTKGFTNTPTSSSNGNCGSTQDNSRIAILERMADKIWEVDPTAYIILEHFADNSEEIILSDYGMLLWGNLNYNYNEATMGYNSNSNFSNISYKYRGWTQPNLVGYMESHDEERLMFKNLSFGNSSGDYNIKDPATSLDRIKLAAVFFFTVPGPKMIWQFGEIGYDYSINYDCRVCNKLIRWDYYDNAVRRKLYKTFAALIDLKKNYDVFRSNDFTTSLSDTTKSIHINHESMDVTIIGNFDVVEQNIVPSFQQAGTWYDFFTGDAIDVIDTEAEITLLPGESHIYTTIQLPTPEEGIYSDIENWTVTIPESYVLMQNYPNPFNPSTVINYSLPESNFVTLKIFNILGRHVKTLVNSEQNAGNHQITWNGKDDYGLRVASGIYFYVLKAQSYFDIKKMVLLK